MSTNTTKVLMLTLLTLSILIFNMPSGHALSINETQKLLASDGAANDTFGLSVSISEETAIVGARNDDDKGDRSGSVYVFVRDSSGVWLEQQKLTASDGESLEFFGESVSISGDTSLISATGDAENGTLSGSAYVFVRDAAGMWSEQQKLTPSDGAPVGFFGRSVSISADTALIGASGDRDNGRDSGAAYVYVRDDAGTWHLQQKLTASDGASGDVFGLSVSLFEDTAVIGASGAAYVFVRDNTGTWNEVQKLNDSGNLAASFGIPVSVHGDTAVVGAYTDDENGDRSGSAYVFMRDSMGHWREYQKLLASDGTVLDFFGRSLSIFGEKIVIAATGDRDKGKSSGSAYVFLLDHTGEWREQQKLIASDGEAVDELGWSSSLAGNTAVLGAIGDDDNGNHSGSAYIFETTATFTDHLVVEKYINHRLRDTRPTTAQLLTGTRYRVNYKVTNNSPDRFYRVQVSENGQLVCNLYTLDPGHSVTGCSQIRTVLAGDQAVHATVTAKVIGSGESLTARGRAFYNGLNESGGLSVTHYINDRNADTQEAAVTVNSPEAKVLFRVENTGGIELYRVRTYHDPASPVNSGWEEKCFIGTLMPGQVRYCKRSIGITEAGLNKAFGRAQGRNANISGTDYVNASNPTYFEVTLP